MLLEGAKLIAELLKEDTSLLELDISDNKIGIEGAIAISQGLGFHKTLLDLNIAQNFISA